MHHVHKYISTILLTVITSMRSSGHNSSTYLRGLVVVPKD